MQTYEIYKNDTKIKSHTGTLSSLIRNHLGSNLISPERIETLEGLFEEDLLDSITLRDYVWADDWNSIKIVKIS